MYGKPYSLFFGYNLSITEISPANTTTMKSDYEDEIRAENALLKLKLELDHGMEASHVSEQLSPAMENAWLNSVLNFEKQLKKAHPVTVFQHLGRPQFKKLDTLRLADVRNETKRLLELMRKKNIFLEHLQAV